MEKVILMTLSILFSISGFSQPNSSRDRLIGVHLCTWQDVDGNGHSSNDEFLNLDKMTYDANGFLRVVFEPKTQFLKRNQKYYVKLISEDTGNEIYLIYKRKSTNTRYNSVTFKPYPGNNRVEYWVEKEGTYTCRFNAQNNFTTTDLKNLDLSDIPKNITFGNKILDKDNDGAILNSEIIGRGKKSFTTDEEVVVVVGMFPVEEDNSSYEIKLTAPDNSSKVFHKGEYKSILQYRIEFLPNRLIKGYYVVKVTFYPSENEYTAVFEVK